MLPLSLLILFAYGDVGMLHRLIALPCLGFVLLVGFVTYRNQPQTITVIISPLGKQGAAHTDASLVIDAPPPSTPQPTAIPRTSATPTPAGPRQRVHTRLIATGDVMLGRMVRVWAEGQGGYHWPFEATQPLISSGD